MKKIFIIIILFLFFPISCYSLSDSSKSSVVMDIDSGRILYGKKMHDKRLIASNIKLISPLDYPDLIWMMNKSNIILTDSGGIQEEAPSLGKPVLVLREVTERMEGVNAGTAILVGSDKEKIIYETNKLIKDKPYYSKIATSSNPYGDGNTSNKIKEILNLNFKN